MKNFKQLKLLINSQSFVPLEESKEGQLRGGFSLLSEGVAVDNCHCDTLPNNCSCNGNNCECPPTPQNNCTCGDRNKNGLADNCYCFNTAYPSPTALPTDGTSGANAIGFWPGLV